MNAHVHLDAASDRDPTGTSGLRRSFVADARRKWDALSTLTRQAIVDHGMLGGDLSLRNLGGVSHFGQWFGTAMRQAVMGGDGRWVAPYIDASARRAQARAAGLLVTRDGAAAPLYVHRPVLNGAEIATWAKSVGFETTLGAHDMHVMVCFSRTPLDWSRVSPLVDTLTIKGGERSMHQFGDGDGRARTPSATVMTISSDDLEVRHREFRAAGASWDHPSYRPHITISYEKPESLDLAKVTPFSGRIILGPEKFEPLKEDWKASVTEDAITPHVLSAVTDTLIVTTIAELQGICDATAQQVARITGHGVLVNASGPQMASEIAAAILKVGVGRTNAMINWMIVKAFAAVTIQAFREAGVSHVGTQAEYIPAPVADAIEDAAHKTPQHRHPGSGKFVTKQVAARELRRVARTGRFRAYRQIEPGTQARAERAQAAFKKTVGMVAVETAEDDLVCFPAFTLVTTPKGDIPIQHVHIGDEVLTRVGFRKVTNVGRRRYAGRLLLVSAVASDLEGVTVPAHPSQMEVTEPVGLVSSFATGDRTGHAATRYWVIGSARSPQSRIMKLAKTFYFLNAGAILKGARRVWRRRSLSFICTIGHPVWCERGGFIPAKELVVGDVLQLVENQRAQVVRVLDFGFGHAHDHPALRLKDFVSAFVGYLCPRQRMPVVSVNLQSSVCDREINVVAPNRNLGVKLHVERFERLPNQVLYAGFSSVGSVTPARAEASGTSNGRLGSCDAAAFHARECMRWSSATLAAKSAVISAADIRRCVDKVLSASGALFRYVVNGRSFTGHRAEVISVDTGKSDSEILQTMAACLGGMSISAGLVAYHRTERAPISGRGKFVAALSAWTWKHFCSLVSHFLTLIARLTIGANTVYNLSVEDQPEFFANSVLVHNCKICQNISDNGPYPINTALGLIPAHPHCRCVFVPADTDLGLD